MNSDLSVHSGSGKINPDLYPNNISEEGTVDSTQHNQLLDLENTLKPQGKWNESAHAFLDQLGAQLEEKMPPNKIQKVLDDFYDKSIEPLLQKGQKLNVWIDTNDFGKWYINLTAFIIKLPIAAIRNIVRLAYNIIKGTIYAFVHPLKALNNLAHIFINFIESLLVPATYTKMGAGIMGAAAGNAIYGFGPHNIIGLAVGGSLIGIGLISGAIKSGIEAEKGEKLEAIKKELWDQIKCIPECALTGFIMGLIFGGIQKAANPPETTTTYVQPSNQIEAQNFVNKVLLDKGVSLDPSAYNVSFDAQLNQIDVTFAGPEIKNSLTVLSEHHLIEPHVVIDNVNNYTMSFTKSLTWQGQYFVYDGQYNVHAGYIDNRGYGWGTIADFGGKVGIPIVTEIPPDPNSLIPAPFSGSIVIQDSLTKG